jgi:cyclophilin family peptidyl-prolyl cis-trans isomerase
VVPLALVAAAASAQVPSPRMAVLTAEDRRAPTALDVATIRRAARSTDAQTARIAIRALGRLERPALIPDIEPGLGHRFPENRAEAANALAQAAQGFPLGERAAMGTSPASVLGLLLARLAVEDEPAVRAAICEAMARLPYEQADDVARAEAAIVDVAHRGGGVADRLGTAKALEAMVRLHRAVRPPSAAALKAMRRLLGVRVEEVAERESGSSEARSRLEADPSRDARVRRLALEALIAADALDQEIVARGFADVDPQVRRLAVMAAAASGYAVAAVGDAVADPAPMVRVEALRGLALLRSDHTCDVALAAAADPVPRVHLAALDQLGGCGSRSDAVAHLVGVANDLSAAGVPRGWHRSARAIVALATAAPALAEAALAQFSGSSITGMRVHAARAATALRNGNVLRTLAADVDDYVAAAAIDGLAKIDAHAADPTYIAALSRAGPRSIRAAAGALAGTPDAAVATPALKSALDRLAGHPGVDAIAARDAITATLGSLGSPPPATPPSTRPHERPEATWTPQSEELVRLAAPRARVTIAALGSFELALFTSEAPATVLRFAALAESGYYDGSIFDRVAPNDVLEGGAHRGSEPAVADPLRDEVGLWPHVRGAVGISASRRDAGSPRFFVNLVDNPRFDHRYTVFAQVLNGMDVVDRIVEGDVIERLEIIP